MLNYLNIKIIAKKLGNTNNTEVKTEVEPESICKVDKD